MNPLAKTTESTEPFFKKSNTKPELVIKLLKLENANLVKTIVSLNTRNSHVEIENAILRKESSDLREALDESKRLLASLLKQTKKYETALKKELCVNKSSSYCEHNGELIKKDSSSSRNNSSS